MQTLNLLTLRRSPTDGGQTRPLQALQSQPLCFAASEVAIIILGPWFSTL